MMVKTHILLRGVTVLVAASVLCGASLIYREEICLCGGWARGWPFGFVSAAACSTAWQTKVFLTPLLLDLGIWTLAVAAAMTGVVWLRSKKKRIAEQNAAHVFQKPRAVSENGKR